MQPCITSGMARHIHKTLPSLSSASITILLLRSSAIGEHTQVRTNACYCDLGACQGLKKFHFQKEMQALRLHVDGLCPAPNVLKSECFLWRPPRLYSQNQSDSWKRDAGEITLSEYGYRTGHWKIFRGLNTQKPKDWLRYLGRLKAWLPPKHMKA